MTQRRRTGDWGEDIAAAYLVERGYRIEARNLRIGRGEIDIVAIGEGVLAMVEVKSGRSRRYGRPEERVTRAKQRQLCRLARWFLQAQPRLEFDIRFDVLVVEGSREDPTIRHYRDAFRCWQR